MNEEPYSFESIGAGFRYEFTSISAEKRIQKLVRFTPTKTDRLYNLALLDVLPDGKTSDLTETNNKDLTTVLATVVQIIIDFFDKNPGTFVGIQGSDAKRQRLYQVVINRELELIQKQFSVLGGNGSDIEVFRKNHSYEFFIIIKKY